jgi:hypothetical protein
LSGHSQFNAGSIKAASRAGNPPPRDTVVGTVHETKRGAAVAFASAPAVVQAADLWKLIANSSRW